MQCADPLPAPVRGGVLGVATAAIGISAHVAGGGAVHSAGLTVGVAALVAWAGTAPVGRHRGPAAVVGVLALGQALLHVTPAPPPGLGHPHPPAGSGLPAVLAGHTTAVLLVGLLLAWTDTVVLAALRIVRGVLRRLRATVPAHAPLWVAVVPAVARDGAKEVLLRRARSRRGPPWLA
ncbi:hypothetical protein [Amycolatopsis sp. MtRt-6]|uniref:hypothetical protein n=1 Tax=Amycolatopsis sp. MtRt-6 TaxID=2792782 RepID=UPI001A90B744|nr:hypothetical protein [Amycolatopsis sp. MtRt-6]